MASVVYADRESVQNALDVATTSNRASQIDDAIEAASRGAEKLCHWDTFAPTLATRSFDWPDPNRSRPYKLWLNQHGLISVTTLVAGGETIPSTDYLLEPNASGPPYRSIEINLGTSSAFAAGDTHQRAIVVTGLWGYRNDETTVGALTANMGASGSAGIQLSPSVGVGAILRIDSERMIVTDKTMATTGQTLGAPGLGATTADVTVPVADGTAFEVGEMLLIGSERMPVTDIAGNNLTVRRAADGSVLAAHSTGATIFALTGFVVERGQLGTTAAAHSSGAAVFRFDPPPLIRKLVRAEAIDTLQQEESAYARTTSGTGGERNRLVTGYGLDDARNEAWRAHARKARKRAV